MWTFFIIALFVLPLWHFIYEGILMPAIRFKLRLELFKIRDTIRRIKIDGGDDIPEAAFSYAERNVNQIVNILKFVDPFVLDEAKRHLANDPQLATRIEQARAEFTQTASEELQEQYRKAIRVGVTASCINSGGWVIYLLPLVLPCMFASHLVKTVAMMASAPPHEIEKMIPSDVGFALA